MAARKSGKVSRRQAVITLGAGLMGGTMGLSASQTAKPPAKPQAKTPGNQKDPTPSGTTFSKCKGKKTTVDFLRKASGSNPPMQLQLASCCEYLRQVLDAGYKTNLDAEIKDNLRKFITMLQQQHSQNLLLDYCFVQFDVKEHQLQSLQAVVARTLEG